MKLNVSDACSYGIIPEKRQLILVGDIDEQTYYKARVGLSLLDGRAEPIIIHLNSHGGSVYAGFGIYDAIRACKSPVHIIGDGCLFSMATVILQAADKRILSPNCTVMIHQTRGAIAYGLHQNLSITAEQYAKTSERTSTILAAKMGISVKRFKTDYVLDKYFDADEAVIAGLADEVLE